MAAKYWVGGGANTNWVTVGNWSTTSGGAGGAGFSNNADDAIFDGVGVNANGVSVVSGNITALSLNITAGFTGTLTFNAFLSVSGNIILGANCTLAGTFSLTCTASGAATLTSNGKVLPVGLNFSGGGTKTLVDNWTAAGSSINAATVLNGNTLFLNGGITTLTFSFTGTTLVVLQGTGNILGTGTYGVNMTITGTYTITSAITFGTGSKVLTCITGNIISTGVVLNIVGPCSINIPTVVIETIVTSGTTITLLSTLNAISIFAGGAASGWAGSFGWITNRFFNQATTAVTNTFQDGIEYVINNSINITTGRIGAICTLTSSHATNRAFLTLKQGATCAVMANFTRIDASGGRTIRTWNGTVTNCINIQAITDLKTLASTF